MGGLKEDGRGRWGENQVSWDPRWEPGTGLCSEPRQRGQPAWSPGLWCSLGHGDGVGKGVTEKALLLLGPWGSTKR